MFRVPVKMEVRCDAFPPLSGFCGYKGRLKTRIIKMSFLFFALHPLLPTLQNNNTELENNPPPKKMRKPPGFRILYLTVSDNISGLYRFLDAELDAQVDEHILRHAVEVVLRLPVPLFAGAGVVEAVGP